ncbi:SIR2 family protein [Paraburkholderia tropica]|uniref:SIR2 family protein n=1 Tax=Paraburkholderia tropica TaxID=92647 RepID=UPI002ABE0E4D|nr:SIR2 family protein [Paraburkholderia tropica]
MSDSDVRFYGADVLLDRLIHAQREVIFFFGSALTIPETKGAPGVPNVSGVIALVKDALHDSPDVDPAEHGSKDLGEIYRNAFADLQARRGQDIANAVIQRAVLQARNPPASGASEVESVSSSDPKALGALDDDIKGWHLRPSVVALGKLLANRPGYIGRTVLTTNFDPLIQIGVRAAGDTYFRTVLSVDGTIGQSQGPGVEVVHLHGYWHGSDTLHVPGQIGQPRPQLKRSLEKLLQNRTLVVMGCGGWDDIFMSCLADLVADPSLNPDVIWAFYEADSAKIRETYGHVLTKLAPAIARSRVHFYVGVDLHAFIPQLWDRLKESPDAEDQRNVNDIMERLQELDPELRTEVLERTDPALVHRVKELKAQQDALERQLQDTENASRERVAELEAQAIRLGSDLQQAQSALTSTQLALMSAAVKDVSWLTAIRTRMMPKQPGRVPFHHSKEVALRGYKASAGGQRVVPLLREVTWARVPEIENGLHRGYKAALVFKGEDFVPGVVITNRRRGEDGVPNGGEHLHWQLSTIYFGDYLELASNDSEPEAQLSWRGYEFQLKNPEGQVSEWVPFTFPFDDSVLEKIRVESFLQGTSLLDAGQAVDAVEPLRKAYVFSDRMYGPQAEETISKKAVWDRAIDEAALAKLRFRAGDTLRVTVGPHAGVSGLVERLLLRHLHAYLITPENGGEQIQASDAQVEKDVAGESRKS